MQEPSERLAVSQRVHPTAILTHIVLESPVPRVKYQPISNITTATILQQRRSALINDRFNNNKEYRYPLRLKTLPTINHIPSLHNKGTNFRNLAAQQLLVQHLFRNNTNQIYR